MKKMFSKMFQMSLFNHILRLAIVVLCLSYSVAASAWSASYYSAVKVEISGEGKVYVTAPGHRSQETLTSTGVIVGNSSDNGMSGSAPATKSHSWSISAEATGNYYFDKLVDGTSNVTSLPYNFSINAKSYDDEGEYVSNAPNKTIKAIFKPYISISDKINFIVYSDGIDIVKFDIKDIYKRESLTLTLEGDDADKFLLGKTDADINHSSITLGTAEGLSATSTTDCSIYLNYSDGEYDPEKALAIGENTYLEIKDNESHTWKVPIRTTAPESFTFLAGAGGKYTVVFANSDNKKIEDITSDQDPTDLRSDMYTLASLTATPNTGYKFFGWQTVDENGVGTYFSYDSQVLNKAFAGGTKIRPVFIPATQATFVIKEDLNRTPYDDLQEALDVAKAKGNSTVVFNAPTKGTMGTLSPRSGGQPYFIPTGVTLLIPGDAAYTCRTKYSDDLPDTDFPAATSSANFSKLILADNTKITLQGGNICVYATISSNMGNNGQPISYGWIEMGENCMIATTASQTSYLYVLGFITGPLSRSSSVRLNEGSIAYEAFQMPDFRGGGALSTLGVASNKKGVFPSEQFYIQSIEVPMTIKSAATLRGIMPANISIIGIVKGEIDIVAKSSGLLQLTNNVELIKYYDSQRDVQVYQVIGQGVDQESSAKIGNVNVNILGIAMDTKDFVLPITSNMEISLEGVTMSSDNRVGMLAGSKIWIKENAIMNQSAQLYVYDKNENKLLPNPEGYNGNGYFGSTNAELVLIKHTPNKSHLNGTANKRTETNLTSAQLRVDGQLYIDGKIKNGKIDGIGLYTTVSGADIVSYTDGARITINNSYVEAAESETLYRLKQKGNEAVQYPTLAINPAWLKNSDGTYLETTGDAVTYQYYVTERDENGNPTSGIWSLPPAKVTPNTWVLPEEWKAIDPKTPVTKTITCQVENVTSANYTEAFVGSLNGTGFTFANGELANSISLEGNILSISVKYTPQNNTKDAHTATLTLKNKQIQTDEFTYTTPLIATEEYIPEFEINPTEVTLPKTNPGVQSSKSDAFTITPTSGTVATLTKADGLTWSYTLDAPFGYTGIVDGILDNENNNVTFNATSGTHTKTLTITATYKPANGGDPVSVSKEVTLIGTSLTPNTLAFDMPSEIKVTQNIPVKFTGQNNASDITVTIDNTSVAELVKNPDGSYVINALSAGTFTLTATQEDAGAFAGTTTTCQITVTKLTPNPTWNWGTVYGNQTYSTPFDPATVLDGKWTLVESLDPTNALAYDETTHTIQVMNVGETTSAQFTFTQEETDIYEPLEQQSYQVTINPDPRILTLVLDNKAKYDIVVADAHSDGVTCNEYGMITLPANGYVIVQFIGIPGDLTFQISEGAEYSAVGVAENTDKTNAETWSEIIKSQTEDKWQFAYANSSCVKLTNTSDTEITLTNLTITENSSYKRDTYYAKAIAVVSPAQAGEVAAKGNYLNTNLENEKLFTSYSPFASTATAYSLAVSEMTVLTDQLAFAFQAQSNPGYYFLEWSPLGSPMIVGDLSWADVYHNYEVYLTTAASDKSIAYSFDTYINLFCQQNQEICSAAKPESGEPNLEAVAYMNAGALALIPATNVGTWQANFALAEVVSAEDAVWEEVTSPNASDIAEHEVVFKVLGDDANDFVATLKDNDGFSFTDDKITLSAVNNTYTINASYAPQDVHGTHTAMLTLARVAVEGVTDESKKTITLTATENLEPYFKLASADFGDGTLGQETIIDILPADKNKVAQVSDPTKLAWTASLSENAPFNIVSIAEDGTCKVRYFRTESGDRSATLTITATYTDSKGTQLPFATTCTLTGSSTEEKAANTLTLVQDIVLYVDDEPISPFSVNDANNTAPITITLPDGCTALTVKEGMIKPSGDCSTGTFTITATQEANAYFQASGSLTTTVTVKKHKPEVTWNWNDLYFGQTYTTPITTNSNGGVTIAVLDDRNIVKYDAETKTLTTDPTLTEGEFNVNFLVSIEESKTYEAYSKTHTATLYKDPRHVRVDVNEALTYRSVTIADKTGENVSFADGGIHFADVAGSEYESRQWTMYFIGVPDQLFFTPSGNNAWEIRESSDGSTWRPTFASSKLPAGEQFAISLSPNTTHVRIVYATNADAPSNGVLNSFYITALEGVKANVDGLYMPIAAEGDNNPTTKQVVLQYTSQEKLTISTSSDPEFTVDVAELPALNVDEYAEQIVVVTSKATQEKEGRIYVKNAAGDILLELPIYTFIFPQTLPIQLATDEPQRFYYVTNVTTVSNYVKWDMTTRVVTLQNAPANKTRSLTFEFDGAPTLLRYNHTAGDRGTWTIRESANNADWYEADPATRVVSGNEIEQGLLTTTRYVQLQYTSPYSEKVEVSNLIIVGDASVTTDVKVLEFTEQEPTKTLTITAFNLSDFNVSVDNVDNANNFEIGEFDKSGLSASVADVLVPITWNATKAVEYATLTITNPNDNDAVLATVELVGTKQSISDPTNIGIYTGLAKDITINGTFEGTENRPVDLSNTFDHTKALFDYLFIYGETSTMDGTSVITTPTGQRGSNAKTPCYIYQRVGDTYKLYKVVDNVNSSEKAIPTYIPVPASDIPLRVYITGFAPYASTGYTKEDEGVWQFRGQAGSKLDVYLEDCYIYSRYKTIDGHSFLDRDNGESFGEQYARGSGGVLVFECSSVNNKENPFNVTIHTMDRNLLKSHYGCFLSSIVGRAYQVSSPVQIHLISTDITATTHLSFDDLWPTAITRTTTDGVVTAENVETKRTNGFLSLQKQVNNAPSIDLGSPNTVVNFNGGQVELQNAQNVSDNYKTTLAISYRGGKFASFFLAHGMGTDEVSGTVNFNDGTTTVIPMTVDERYRQYYLMDEDEHGNELATTSTLRCPKNTYVYGGSHCMMRACNEPTSKGGAPWSHDGEGAVRLGLYKYPYAEYTTVEGDNVVIHAGGWTLIEGGNGLVKIPEYYIPNIKVGDQVARQYGVASVMPNDNGTDNPTDDYLNFWVPAGYDDSVTPEVDMKISYWKAAMTHIKAEYASDGGEVGGNITIGDDSNVETELVYNLLYCALDDEIRAVISSKEEVNGQEVYSYAAPVKHPTDQGYLSIRPSFVGTDVVNYVENQNSYKVQNRVYYVTPIPSADNWMTFTAPFDVDNIYIVETYDERTLSTMHGGDKAQIKLEQAKHNADFAAFFGVALALGSDRDFDDIYANYIGWAKLQDVGKYTGEYNLRGKYPLEFYDGTNWSFANYYIYENQDVWTINSEGVFETQWTLPDMSDSILMNKGETYSLLFPYCTGCWEYDDDGNLEPRTMWDYWSGKFIIFESTYTNEPHVINGLNEAQKFVENNTPREGETYITGNTSFGELKVTSANLYTYNSINPMKEFFEQAENIEKIIWPTNSFALADIPKDEITKMPARGVSRTGGIIYGDSNNGNQNGTTGGRIPTVGGGNDLFITSIAGGINVAVAAPQNIRVLSSTGSVIYSGYVTTAVDITLPANGIYIVSGENEVQKILF